MKTTTLIITCFFLITSSGACQSNHPYQVIKTYHIASGGGWDYIAVNDGKLYVSHSTQVNILDENSGDSIGIIPNTNGVHGIAFDNALGKGFTSNGRSNNVTVFELKTNKLLGEIVTGENPDAILYEPFSKKIITCNGRSKDLSIIDPVEQKVIATIPVGGKPEAAVSDKNGKLFVNIEDISEIVEVNTQTFKVLNHWPVTPGKSPTGLALDTKTNRLFSGCETLLMVVDAVTGKIIDKLPIGDGCDGVAFDEKNKIVFTSNGEGTLTAIEEKSANKFKILGNYPTKRGARTITRDEKTGTIFLPTSE
ncbi:MAG: YncE family protein, partial [Bacteroidota bacterium]|nr:YncE family protein [Bacteroidota bacterium]